MEQHPAAGPTPPELPTPPIGLAPPELLTPPEGLSSRDKILWAAATMLGDAAASPPSVRAVAARAGVSAGAVQHHFRTQRELMDEVLILFYDTVYPDFDVRDSSVPARDRLVSFLQRLLAPTQPESSPRDSWITVFDRYIQPQLADPVRDEYLAIERELLRRIEYCLAAFQEEGVLAPGDNARRARFLYAVINGLSIAQALPAGPSLLSNEIDVLRMAAGYVLNESSPL